MQFFTYGRYGEQTLYDSAKNAERIAQELIDQLRTEQDEVPDDEHSSVSLGQGNFSISVNVSGLVTLLDQSWLTSKSPRKAIQEVKDLYLRDVQDSELVKLMRSLAVGDLEGVKKAPWVSEDELPPYVRDFYRHRPRG